ncbi:MAG: nitroreductase family protein [Smithella sp.]
MLIEKIEDKCSECMLCVRDCVMGVWRNVNGKSSPAHMEMCNGCSHCIAVCPCDAIIHNGLKKEEISDVHLKNLSPDVYRDTIVSRRSIRQFKNQPVPRDVIEKILDVASYAPTARNQQKTGYVVITDQRLIEETAQGLFRLGSYLYNKTKKGVGRLLVKATGLSRNPYFSLMDYVQEQNAEKGRDFILHNAPVVILIHGPKRKAFISDDCNIAATTIINYAHTLGLGTCFVGMMTLLLRYSGRLRKKLGVPRGRRAYTTLVMGYPAYRYRNTVFRKKPDVRWLS